MQVLLWIASLLVSAKALHHTQCSACSIHNTRPVIFYCFVPHCICPHALLCYVCTCVHVHVHACAHKCSKGASGCSLVFLLATASSVMCIHRITIQMTRQCSLLENINIPVALSPCLLLWPLSTLIARTICSEAMTTERSHMSNFKP